MKTILFIVGALLIWGGIGACDTGSGTFGQAIVQCLIGLPMFAISCM